MVAPPCYIALFSQPAPSILRIRSWFLAMENTKPMLQDEPHQKLEDAITSNGLHICNSKLQFTLIETKWCGSIHPPLKLQTKVTYRNMIRINFWRGFFNKWCWGRNLCFDSFLAIEFSICAKEKEKEKDHDIQLIYGTM